MLLLFFSLASRLTALLFLSLSLYLSRIIIIIDFESDHSNEIYNKKSHLKRGLTLNLNELEYKKNSKKRFKI